jgi:hypothetical protein
MHNWLLNLCKESLKKSQRLKEMRFQFILLNILLFVIVFPGCRGKKNSLEKSDLMIGVKVYNIDRELKSVFEEWESLGINTVLASPSVFNDQFSALAKKHDIETFIILPIFYDPDALQVHPDLYAITDKGEQAMDDWVEFVCPSREDYRKSRIEYVSHLVRDLDPDGISLDFIRFFCFWEKIYPDRHPDSIPNTCFCPYCLDQFQSDKNISIPASLSNVRDIAGWIKDNYQAEWIDWKCSLITEMVRDIVTEAKKIKPGLKVNLHAVPWRQDDFDNAIRRIVAQDFSALAEYCDIISPMTYSHMVKREPDWIQSVVNNIKGQVDCRVIPSIQVNEAYLTDILSAEEFEQTLMEALKPPSSGVFFWSWEQLEERPEKKAIIEKVMCTL